MGVEWRTRCDDIRKTIEQFLRKGAVSAPSRTEFGLLAPRYQQLVMRRQGASRIGVKKGARNRVSSILKRREDTLLEAGRSR